MALSCKDAVGLLVDYVDTALRPELVSAMRSHFNHCPLCVAFTDSYRKTVSLCRHALAKEAPDGLTDRVLSFVRRNTTESN